MDKKLEEEVWQLINYRRFEEAKAILLKEQININHKSDGEVSILQCAVKSRNFDMVKLVLDEGADIESRDVCGNTPLMKALSCYDHLDDSIIKLLVNRGADVEAVNSYNVFMKDMAKNKAYEIKEK